MRHFAVILITLITSWGNPNMSSAQETISDYDAIQATIGNYFDGLRHADRARLEKAFAVDVAHMKGYIKDKNGQLSESSRPMNEVIDEWVARDPNPNLQGRILSINIYSDIAAQVTFDFNGVFTDAFQLAKINGEWRDHHLYSFLSTDRDAVVKARLFSEQNTGSN